MESINSFSKKNTIIKRIIFADFLIAVFSIQSTGGLFFAPFNINAVLIIPLTVSISMFEREFAGIFYGLLAGAMSDAFNASTVCYNAIFFTVVGFACGALITYLMRNNLVCAVMLTAVVSLLYNTIYFLLFFAFKDIQHPFITYIINYFVSAIYTTLLTPIFYLAVRAIYKKFKVIPHN